MSKKISHQFQSDKLLEKIQDNSIEPSLNQIKRMVSNMNPSEIAHALNPFLHKKENYFGQ